MAEAKYPWDIWLKRRKKFSIKPIDYDTNLATLSQILRNRISKEGLTLSLEVSKSGDRLKVLIGEKSA